MRKKLAQLTTTHKAFIALVIANVIWGGASAIFKLSLQNIPLYTLAFWRFFLGAIILFFIARKHIFFRLQSNRDGIYLFLYALFGITINIIFFFEGLKRTLSINGPIITSSQPILVLFLALLFLHEKFKLKKFLGMILGTIGMIIIVIEPLLEAGFDGSIVGNIFLVIATCSAVAQMIVGKKVLNRYHAIGFTFWAFLIGAATFFPMMIYEYATIPAIFASLDWRGYLGLIYGAVFSSAAAYSLFAWGLSKIQATDVAVFAYIDPVIGVMAGSLLLHEPITVPFIIGSVFIFAGISLAEGHFRYHPFNFLFHRQTEKKLI